MRGLKLLLHAAPPVSMAPSERHNAPIEARILGQGAEDDGAGVDVAGGACVDEAGGAGVDGAGGWFAGTTIFTRQSLVAAGSPLSAWSIFCLGGSGGAGSGAGLPEAGI